MIEENVRIQGQRRMLAGILAYPPDQARAGALIAGPHPFLGGDMGNNVVSALLKTLASRGAVTLAFDYGGVGESEGGPADRPAAMSAFWKEGALPEEGDWADDAGAALAALRQWCDLPPVLIGYSFGCWTVVRHAQGSEAAAIVLISPNPRRHAFDALSGCPAPLLMIHSDNDFTCSVSEIMTWFESIREPKRRVRLSAGEHFFRGRETEVTTAVLEFL
ncbi:MAG: alpha/beta hydrolase, partial [Phycisphaerae bacterium]